MTSNFIQYAKYCNLGSQMALVGVTGYLGYALLKYGMFQLETSCHDYAENIQKIYTVPITGLIMGVTLRGVGNCLETMSQITEGTTLGSS